MKNSRFVDSRKFLSDAEYRKVIAATLKLPDPVGIALRFILETGCRCGEALLVRPRHIDWKSGMRSTVKIPTFKRLGHPALPVDLDNRGDLAQELRVWVRVLDPDRFLFEVSKRTLQRAFERILDRIKPDRVGLIHILRHTRAKRLIDAGFGVAYVWAQLRWTSMNYLKNYVSADPKKVESRLKGMR